MGDLSLTSSSEPHPESRGKVENESPSEANANGSVPGSDSVLSPREEVKS